ncbi:hypothetical protein [Xenorhabdus bharatensis]|uniref:hypothetical protein n=1 Tax=Xenorhabdus bharatensis TaxID=3136256 RepID=UPI0030F4580D
MPRAISDFEFYDKLTQRFNILKPYMRDITYTPPKSGIQKPIPGLVIRLPVGDIEQIKTELEKTGLNKKTGLIEAINSLGFKALQGNHSQHAKEREYLLNSNAIPVSKESYTLYILPHLDKLYITRRSKNPILVLLEKSPKICQDLWEYHRNHPTPPNIPCLSTKFPLPDSFQVAQFASASSQPGPSNLSSQRHSPILNTHSPRQNLYDELSEFIQWGVPYSEPSSPQRSLSPQAGNPIRHNPEQHLSNQAATSKSGWNNPLIASLITHAPPSQQSNQTSSPIQRRLSPQAGGSTRHQSQPQHDSVAQYRSYNWTLPEDWDQ